MKKETQQATVDQKSSEDVSLNYYELALYFAAAKSQKEEFHWADFIDDLSFICDKFATHIQANGKSQLGK